MGKRTKTEISRDTDNTVLFQFPFSLDVNDAIKNRVPRGNYMFSRIAGGWIVGRQYLPVILEICQEFGLNPHVEGGLDITAGPEQRQFKIMYIGSPKDRGDGRFTAYGHDGTGWNVIFPQEALQLHFEGETSGRPDAATSLYGALMVSSAASGLEIKRAFKKQARRWHPDVCQETDAPEMFKLVNQAYEVLSDPVMRKRYDAGRKLQAMLPKEATQADYRKLWRPPVRCGWVTAEGHVQLRGQFLVERILAWEDVVDTAGRVMVTYWSRRQETCVVEWIEHEQ